MSDANDPNGSSLSGVKQLGLFAAIASLSDVFWLYPGKEKSYNEPR